MQANVGYSAEGHARSGMGVDAADYDQDGWVDLFVTNVDREMYSLYHNNQDETFDDMAIPNGIGRVTRLMSGWGVKYFRLRQRWQSGLIPGQRPSGRQDRSALHGSKVLRAYASVPRER